MTPYNKPTEPLHAPHAPQKSVGKKRPLLWVGVLIIVLMMLVAGAFLFINRTPGPGPGPGGEYLGKGPWHTNGSQILDANNQPVKIAGVNWFGFETDTFVVHGLQNRSYQDMLKQIKEAGYNTIRLPYSNQLFDTNSQPQGIDYSKNPDLQGLQGLQLMDKIISYASSIGLHIILDQHRPDARAQSKLWYTDAYPEQKWLSDWQMLAQHYKDYPFIIGADLHNEPSQPACWGCGQPNLDWQQAATRAGNAILAINPNWLIFVEGVDCVDGQQGNNDCYWAGGNLAGVREHPVQLSISGRLVYSVHDYPASVFGQPWFTQANYPQNLTQVWDSHWGYIQESGVAPVWVGEFGTRLQTEQDKQWFEALVHYLGPGANGISWTFWSWNPDSTDTGGILQDDWTTLNQSKQLQLQTIQFPLGGHSTSVASQPIATQQSITPAANQAALTLSYQSEMQNTQANELKPALKLINTGTSPISLSDVTLRYWYTADGSQEEVAQCYYATIDCMHVRLNIVKMEPARTGADSYLEISFTGGTLAAGAHTEIKLGIHKSGWMSFDQSNDYSFVGGTNGYGPNEKVGVYEKGVLVSGREPT